MDGSDAIIPENKIPLDHPEEDFYLADGAKKRGKGCKGFYFFTLVETAPFPILTMGEIRESRGKSLISFFDLNNKMPQQV